MKNNNQKHGIIVLILIIIITILFAIANIFNLSIKSPIKNTVIKTNIIKKNKDGYIAKLFIEGIIQNENQEYNQKWLLETIYNLKDDKQNKGIALVINSPGGAVYEADEIYLALQDYKTSGKPIFVYQTNLAASGGYYISCAANKIFANRNTLTGSIGVITGSSFDITGLLNNLGIKSETIHSGKNKNMFNFNEPVTEEQKQIMQSLSDECYEQFTSIVAMNRNIPIFEVKKIADGRIYTAKQALENGLIDSIDSFENMIKNIEDEYFEGKTLNVVDFKYKHEPSFKDFLLQGILSNTELKSIDKIISKNSIQYPALIYCN